MTDKKKAFVTGAAGFIGNLLVDELLAQGWEVSALVHETADGLSGKPVSMVRGSLLDRDSMLAGMTGCAAVFHLAALVSFAPSDHEDLLKVNRDGTRLLLDCAAQAGVEKVVVTSSACTLGVHQQPVSVNEDTPCLEKWRRNNVYLDSKRALEEVCLEFHDKGLQVVVVLPTTVFGPGDRKMNSGIFFKQVMSSPFVIIPPGGTSVIDIEDVVQGHLAAFRHGRSGERYVLTGQNISFAELYETIGRLAGISGRMIHLPRWSRPLLRGGAMGYCLLQRLRGRREWQLTPQIVGDAFAYKWYSPDKAVRELDWQPVIPFVDSVRRALDYYRLEGLL